MSSQPFTTCLGTTTSSADKREERRDVAVVFLRGLVARVVAELQLGADAADGSGADDAGRAEILVRIQPLGAVGKLLPAATLVELDRMKINWRPRVSRRT
jgi:hypothetical protein